MKRSCAGIHCNGSPEACETLVHLLGELSGQTGEVHRTIPVKPLDPKLDPTGFDAKALSFATLRLEVADPDDDVREMCAWHEEERAFVRITRPFVPSLVKALQRVRDGEGDFGLSPRAPRRTLGPRDKQSELLVFWWQRRA